MRVNAAHWQLFLQIAENSPELLTSAFNGPQGKAHGNELWKSVAARLNGLGYGEKTIGEWRRALTDWKSKTKIKASKLRCSYNKTGGGGCETPPLTELEEKLLSLMGKKCLDGDDVNELGLSKTNRYKEIKINKESDLSNTASGSRTAEGSSRVGGDAGGGSSEEDISRQPQDLKQRLQDEASMYRRRLETHRQTQQNQAALVSRLEAKDIEVISAPSPSTSQIPTRTNNTNIPFTNRNINLLTSPSVRPKTQKKRKISSIPKIGQNLEEMTSESVRIFKDISKNTEIIAANSSRIANSLEELLLHFKKSKYS